MIDVSKMDRKQKEEAVNEVNVLKSMRHPFIVGYRESFMDKKYQSPLRSIYLLLLSRYLCIVMDYADGGDMYTKISKQKKLGKGFRYKSIKYFSKMVQRESNTRLVCADRSGNEIYSRSKGFASRS